MPQLADPRAGERFWQTLSPRSAATWGRWWWESRNRPYRRALLLALQRFSGVSSLLELGSGSGPNLLLAAHSFPGARLTGIEASSETLRLALEWLAAEGISGVQLRAGTFAALLPTLPDASEDLVFSCYALAYVHPSALPDVLRHALRIARLGVVLAEPQVCRGERRELIAPFNWRHDYARALERLGIPSAVIHVEDIAAGRVWPEVNAVLSVDLGALRAGRGGSAI